jgi:hypothetical protein
VSERMLMGAAREKRFRRNAQRAAGASFWQVAMASAFGGSPDSSAATTAPSSSVPCWGTAAYCKRHGSGLNGASAPIKFFIRLRRLTRITTFGTSGTGRLKE